MGRLITNFRRRRKFGLNDRKLFGNRFLIRFCLHLRAGDLRGVRLETVLPVGINLGAKYLNFFRGFDPDLDGVAIDAGDLNVDTVSDDYAFVDL